MKKLLVKFSDERNKKYSICTIIAEDETTGEKFVLKEGVYPEGKQHLKNIVHYAEVLKTAYPDVKITPVCMLEDGSIRFDFIEGESLDSRYRKCMMKNDKAGMESLLKQHKALILGAEENQCDFQMTDEFKAIFGMDEWTGKKGALKVTNFDATASNILFENQNPVFIDYEWIYEFPIPKDLALYHCIRDMYYHIDGLQAFYPLNDAMKLLGVTSDQDMLEDAYKKFYSYVVSEKDGSSFALCKTLFTKGSGKNIAAMQEEIEQLKLNNIFYEEQWKKACEANDVSSEKIALLEQECEKNAEMIIELKQELAFAEKNWREACQAVKPQNDAEQWRQVAEDHARQAETWRVAYETVVNSRTWRLAGKFKKLLGRK